MQDRTIRWRTYVLDLHGRRGPEHWCCEECFYYGSKRAAVLHQRYGLVTRVSKSLLGKKKIVFLNGFYFLAIQRLLYFRSSFWGWKSLAQKRWSMLRRCPAVLAFAVSCLLFGSVLEGYVRKNGFNIKPSSLARLAMMPETVGLLHHVFVFFSKWWFHSWSLLRWWKKIDLNIFPDWLKPPPIVIFCPWYSHMNWRVPECHVSQGNSRPSEIIKGQRWLIWLASLENSLF